MTEDDLKRQSRRGPFASLYGIKDQHRALSTFTVIFLVLAGITALIVWLVCRPHDPKFKVVSLVINDFNFTSPPYMSTTMQFTVVTRNPNERVSFYYDQLSAFVSYKNQVITPPLSLPPLYHDPKSTVALSPVLGGGAVPVSVEVANGLKMDQSYGVVNLKLILTGKVRYKGGVIRTRHYGIYVNCDVSAGFKQGFTGQVPLLGSSECQVDA
ncbi:NDR1/HIN1-like protein 12 [Olea europaea var. sylvestris]|uniref:NDR1 HIN1 12 n=1 Tax=Olea europaea subsp. europaea TaxID=158383 RepID=A0A8S0SS69_OLEEU|nr:NDR1/HIN1-like protein 12 [Olea europaea var. sylvestris]CAA2995198.1 NDR1 HIN1 12 [Olea europaea subsp. europaea]